MALRQVLRKISHAINERVAVILVTLGFLRKKVPPTPENVEALEDIEEAARGLRTQAEELERATRTKSTP